MQIKLEIIILLLTTLKTTNATNSTRSSPFLEDDINHTILGGVDTDIVNIPYQALILLNHQPRCGGSIISPVWILTAAHCVINKPSSILTVHVGSTNFYDAGQQLTVYDVNSHPGHVENVKPVDYDIAVLQVSQIYFNQHAAPISLLPMNQPLPPTGTPVLASGWGVTQQGNPMEQNLRSVMLKMVDFDQCQQSFPTALTPRMFCAGDDGLGISRGDSGGPLVWNGIQIGVSSFIYDYSTAPHLVRPGGFANLANWELREYIQYYTGV